jgi:metallo-beta-lactamase class B
LKKLGFDPANIKYAIVSHAHIDHIGGAKCLQDTYGTRIVMSAADWDLTEKSPRLPAEIKPRRDVVVADGDKLTLGDTTLPIHLTPSHHARDDIAADPGKGWRTPASRRHLGRHGVQFRAD